jgi:hypothetical protein
METRDVFARAEWSPQARWQRRIRSDQACSIFHQCAAELFVMPALGASIDVFLAPRYNKDVDGRDKSRP